VIEFYPFSFAAEVTTRDFGNYSYVCLRLPEGIAPALPFNQYPRLRVRGEIAGFDFEGAWQPEKDAPYWLMVPKDIQKAAALELGMTVRVAFDIADQNAVSEPPELVDAFHEAPEMRSAWDALTPGKRRGYCYQIEKAKAPATKRKRIDALFSDLGA